MVKHIHQRSGQVVALAPESAKYPQFVFAPEMGKKCIDEIVTDLMLITVLAGMDVPRDLRAKDCLAGDLIRKAIKSSTFEGKRGDRLLLETGLPTTTAAKGRRLLVAGLGRRDQFCAAAAYGVFEGLVLEALKLQVNRVTIPFTPNRGTGSCLTMKGMAHQMNRALTNCFKQVEHPGALKEVQIYCTPQARAHIVQGLEISTEQEKVCCHA